MIFPAISFVLLYPTLIYLMVIGVLWFVSEIRESRDLSWVRRQEAVRRIKEYNY